jgi:DNA-binding MarR family transcriptional regulator
MIGSWDTENLSSSEQFADLAHAYLDCSILLCCEMSKKSFSATFSRGRVILFLSLHSVELFLKGAILKRSPSVALNTHALRDLQSNYNKLYTEDRFRWELPFKTEYLGFTAQEVKTMLKSERPLDQMYRYPINRKGNPWPGVVGFEAKEFLRKLQNIKEDFCRLEKQIFASIPNRGVTYNVASGFLREMSRYTEKQGQYLAFIYYYTKISGRSPSEAEMQAYFGVTPPTVHQMVLSLEKNGLITRTAGQARSIKLLLPRHELPDLE